MIKNLKLEYSTKYLIKCSCQVYSTDSYIAKSGLLTIKLNRNRFLFCRSLDIIFIMPLIIYSSGRNVKAL